MNSIVEVELCKSKLDIFMTVAFLWVLVVSCPAGDRVVTQVRKSGSLSKSRDYQSFNSDSMATSHDGSAGQYNFGFSNPAFSSSSPHSLSVRSADAQDPICSMSETTAQG